MGDTLTAETVPAGTPDVTYQWYRDGEPIDGATDPTYVPGEDDQPKSAIAFLRSKGVVVLWAAFMVLFVATLVFGMYGLGYDSGSFIYARI